MMRRKWLKRSFLLGGVAILALAVLPGSWAQPSPQGKREGKGPEGWMKLETRPDGAFLYIDGQEKNGSDGSPMATPLIVGMPAGSHDLMVKLGGYQEWRDSVQVYAAETTQVLIHLGPLWTPEQYERQEHFATNVGISLAALLVFIGLVMK
jgi:hypothetical protein